jgi:putative addiction module component (TIGR02574 family)
MVLDASEEIHMSNEGKQILARALKLPPTERVALIEEIFSSFDFPSRKEIDALYADEAESRVDAFERGEISSTPARRVFEKIEKFKK